MKSEDRRPKAERRPKSESKPEVRSQSLGDMAAGERASDFGLRTSDFIRFRVSGFGFRRSCQRQLDGEPAALATALRTITRPPWASTMCFTMLKTNAHALGLAPQLGAAPVEALEDLLVLGGRDAGAVVLDPEEDA